MPKKKCTVGEQYSSRLSALTNYMVDTTDKTESPQPQNASDTPKETRMPHGPDIVLRSFQPSDLAYAKHMFYSTYFNVVPEGVKRKFMSPLTWTIYVSMCKFHIIVIIGCLRIASANLTIS